MSDEPKVDDGLTRLVRAFMVDVREEAAKREEHDVVDRVIAAASLVFTALAIAWPKDRRLPWLLAALRELGRKIWQHQKTWLT